MTAANDTIFALSSGRPPAAIAVVRISGPRARAALEALIGRVPEPRKAALAKVRDPATGEPIDQALVLWFPGPRSETGEDVAELQLHGGHAVIAATLAALGRVPGLRLAEPGEFTRRAFDHGQLDLTQVEALADLIGAETEAQRRQAYRQMRGLLGDRAEEWRTRAIEALAQVEAAIDFADEGDVPKDLIDRALAIARPLADDINAALAGAARGERLREGLWVVIAGPPNAGKSTLLNRIARREAAIVSPIAGTTRDVIEVHLDLNGYPVNLIDTAGIRESSDDPVEREGMRRAREQAARANLVLWVVEATEADSLAPPPVPGIPHWTVLNKIDLVSPQQLPRLEWQFKAMGRAHRISATTGDGLDALLAALVEFAERTFTLEPALVTRERQRRVLTEVVQSLVESGRLAEEGAGEELVAEKLRLAASGLGRLTGRVDVEDILDVIFRDFCIGK
ncbi:MAG: tRNA uridine-5-carboxymethylaminomethyl(34) synthesis GTPase MnmE [Xanthobacteraceae bacterium]|nr:tRNA uridine-5-carboxymethylaminomethyl(34) synthesis GTPase MnmE [Xanthobacteraceae bacterium]